MNLKQFYMYVFVFLVSLSVMTGCGGGSTSEPSKEASVNDVGALVNTPVTQDDLAITEEILSNMTEDDLKVATWIPTMEDSTVNSKTTQKIAYMKDIKVLSQKLISNGERTDGWMVYDKSPLGATIESVTDTQKGDVLKLSGDALNNGYVVGYSFLKGSFWNDKTNKSIKWSMKYDEDFIIYVRVSTTDGYRYLYYTSSNKNYGEANYDKPHYIHNGLGATANDGTWRTFTRDLSADLKRHQPDNELISVDGFFVRGSGYIDDVELFSTNSEQTNMVMYEDAEDGKNSRWGVYTSSHEGMISNIDDGSKSSRIIELNGEATKTGYILGAWEKEQGWKNTTNKKISWDMNYCENYVVYVSVETEQGHRFITYSPLSEQIFATTSDYESGVKVYGDYTYIHLGLNPNTKGCSWQTVSRDLEADLKRFEPNNSLKFVNTFLVRGSGKLDNIQMFDGDGNESDSNPDEPINVARTNSNDDAELVKSIDDKRYTFRVYTNSTPDTEISQDAMVIYVTVNDEIVTVSLNNSYPTNALFQIRMFDEDGKELGSSAMVNYDASSMDAGTINILVVKENIAPVATPTTVTVNKDTTDNVIILNGTDSDGDSLTYEIVKQPSHGTVTLSGNIAKYTPTANYAGADSFSFKVNDEKIDSAPATVTITVTDVAEPNIAPVATPTTVTVKEDTTDNIITLNGTDSDGDSLTYSIVKQPTHGTVTLSGNVAKYTPTANYFGADSFSFKVNDGKVDSKSAEVTITVIEIETPNKAPTVNAGADKTVTINSSVTLNGTASDSDGSISSIEWKKGSDVLATTLSFSYTPTEVGTDMLILVVVDDDGVSGSDSINITIQNNKNIRPR